MEQSFCGPGVFCILMTIFSCLGMMISFVGGKQVIKQQVQLVPGEDKGQMVGPISLTQASRADNISLQSGSLPTGGWGRSRSRLA